MKVCHITSGSIILTITIGIGIIISIISFMVSKNLEEKDIEIRFELYSKEFAVIVQNNINNYVSVLNDAGYYFSNSNEISREQFSDFSRNAISRHPGIHALSWNPLIKDDEREAFESSMKESGFKNFELKERTKSGKLIRAKRRGEYVAVHYIDPLENNKAALGYDVASNPTRLQAITQGFSTGKLSATGRITLVQGGANQFGVLLFLPIYKSDALLNTSEKLYKYRKGFAVEVLRIGDVIELALKDFSHKDINLELYDISAPKDEQLLFSSLNKEYLTHKDSLSNLKTNGFYSKTIIQIGQRTWHLIITPSKGFIESQKTIIPITILIVEWLLILLFILIFIYYYKIAEWASFALNNPAPVLRATFEGKILKYNYPAKHLLQMDLNKKSILEVFDEINDEVIKKILETETYTFEQVAIDAVFQYTIRKDNDKNSLYIYGSDISKIKAVQNEMKKILQQMNERIKELNCLYGISGAIQKFNSLQSTFKEILKIIIKSWKYPELTCARISINNSVYISEPFLETVWKLSSDIIVHNKKIGTLDVFYMEELPTVFEGPFLKEEGDLIDGISRILGQMIDHNEAEKEVRKLSLAVEQSPVTVVITDKNGRIEYANSKFTEITGYSIDEAIGENPRILNSGRQSAELYKELWDTILTGKEWYGEFCNRTKNGDIYWEHASISSIKDKEGKISNFVGVKEDITESKRIAEELRIAKEDAENANQSKSTFLANMSHEIRTPMNAILGFSQLLYKDSRLTEDQKENIDIINRSGEHLLSIINDILEISKIEAGHITLNSSTFDLHQLLDDLRIMFTVRAEEKNLTLDFHNSETVPRYIVTDAKKLRQIMMNLLGNAVKFTENGGIVVNVDADVLPDNISLHVKIRDTGPGILQEDIDKIFGHFEQSQAGKNGYGGTGLGLAISKEFVNLMGGAIYVKSNLGEGSEFYFNINVKIGEFANVESLYNAKQVIGLKNRDNNYCILIADDKDTNRKLLVDILKPVGFEVKEAVNGKEAVSIAKEWFPDLILMDIAMPIMNGGEATIKIKSLSLDKNIRIIAITASAFAEDLRHVLSNGADDFIRKPFKEYEVFKKIGKYLDIEFEYAENNVNQSSAKESDQKINYDLFVTIPDKLLNQLKEATINGDIDLLNELLNQLQDYDQETAGALRLLVEEFEFEQLGKILNLDYTF